MSEQIYCAAQTYHATRDSPAEWCEEEVDSEGDLCPIHEEADDDFNYERHREELAERLADPENYYRDFGD